MTAQTWKHGDHQFHVRRRTLDASILRETYVDRDYDIVTLCADDCWLDVGAHIGAFAVLASPQVASVQAYEPELHNFKLLNLNLTLNACRNVETHQQAIAGQTGQRVLWKHPWRNTAAHSLIERENYLPERTYAVDINNVLQGITCVKIDVEGAEWEIVLAVKGWQDVRQIVVEYHHLLSPAYREFLAMLNRHFRLTEYPINEQIKCNHVVGVRK